jgi:uncharacterized protein (DUF1330 family)
MTAYVVYLGEVTDPAQYDLYRAESGPSVAAAGGRFVARGGDVDPLEGGAPPSRTVLIEFDSMAEARAWYDSERYQRARRLREGAANLTTMYVVDGA